MKELSVARVRAGTKTMLNNARVFSSLLTISTLGVGGCYIQSGPMPPPQPYVAQPPPPPEQPVVEVAAAPEYYYGGPHFYPAALGGDWCPIAEAHTHDFPPDHPEYYAYDSGYYYYSGRPGEVYVVGSAPRGVRIHEVREHELHGAGRLPENAARPPHLATGRYPTRDTHPAPVQPTPSRDTRDTRVGQAKPVGGAQAVLPRTQPSAAEPHVAREDPHTTAAADPHLPVKSGRAEPAAAPTVPAVRPRTAAKPVGNARKEPTEGPHKDEK
jgi:hypothetical protein